MGKRSNGEGSISKRADGMDSKNSSRYKRGW